jgi:hypothetical protein
LGFDLGAASLFGFFTTSGTLVSPESEPNFILGETKVPKVVKKTAAMLPRITFSKS